MKEIEKFAKSLDRSNFIDNEYKAYAELDRALPIDYGQTISQPSLVRFMTHLLGIDKKANVLEIGTGSGYQTAFLSKFFSRVYTVERIPVLSEKAKERLDKLGLDNIRYIIGDGSLGYLESAPYDRIIVTAGSSKVPDELIEQLNMNGCMIIPVGDRSLQQLMKITKDGRGKVTITNAGKVVFVELKGKYGWE